MPPRSPPSSPRSPNKQSPRSPTKPSQRLSASSLLLSTPPGDSYSFIYHSFACFPPTCTPDLPNRLLERYNQHFSATFRVIYLPKFDAIKNFHARVIEALCEYFAFERLFPHIPADWRRDMCEALLVEAKQRGVGEE
ncbi:hypothetical protein BDD12DRAFT_894285 [Trichophaea hybrida]|nr:hypothetical protein BDD12DRAFT_894285 [Trichophaea hybrida]